MKQFRFRLDPVLGHRERTENERAGEHARSIAARLAAEADRDDLIARRDAARERLTREHNTLELDELRFTYAHLEYLDRAIGLAQLRVDACAAEAEKTRLRLVDASRDRKVLETLKDRRKEAYLLEGALLEQRDLDDSNARLYDRVQPSEGQPT